MKKLLLLGITALVIATAAPAQAADHHQRTLCSVDVNGNSQLQTCAIIATQDGMVSARAVVGRNYSGYGPVMVRVDFVDLWQDATRLGGITPDRIVTEPEDMAVTFAAPPFEVTCGPALYTAYIGWTIMWPDGTRLGRTLRSEPLAVDC